MVAFTGKCLCRCLRTSMISNTKLLVVTSLLITVLGFSFLWFGLRPSALVYISPTATPLVENGKEVISTQSAVESLQGEKALVAKVIDGDTIELEDGNKLRLIGVDTPETVDPRRPVGCFGKEASNATKKLLSGKEVILQKDVSETDKYGRLLRYVYLPLENGQTLFVNDYLIREGFAVSLTYPPDVKFTEQFLQAEKQAREQRRGLWGRC